MAEKNDAVAKEYIDACLAILDSVRSGLALAPAEDSLLTPLAKSGMEMSDCYRSDAADFIGMNDYVTAFAAVNYSHAWIMCFTELGLFSSVPGPELYTRLPETASDDIMRITDEKMSKYLDITSRARKKLKIASPDRSFGRRLAERFLERSDSYYSLAQGYSGNGDYVRAFAAVNYSHAWLDGGARIGLFDVDGDDVLFTLYE